MHDKHKSTPWVGRQMRKEFLIGLQAHRLRAPNPTIVKGEGNSGDVVSTDSSFSGAGGCFFITKLHQKNSVTIFDDYSLIVDR